MSKQYWKMKHLANMQLYQTHNKETTSNSKHKNKHKTRKTHKHNIANHPKPNMQKQTKNTFLHVQTKSTIFRKLSFLCNLHPFLCKSCAVLNFRKHDKNSVFSKALGQKSRRTKDPRIFRIFVPNSAPNFASNFPRFFWGVFVLRFVGNGDQKKFTKNPRHFSMQNPQANSKTKSTKVFWRAGKVTKHSFCGSQIVNRLLETPSKNTLFVKKGDFGVVLGIANGGSRKGVFK